MSMPYEEIFEGEVTPRAAPGNRHELVCARLHATVRASVANIASTRLLEPRAQVNVTRRTTLCPDLALVTVATNKLWLAAEVVSSDDHHNDTVVKKQIYEEIRVSRLWMIDPRYDNVEVYHASEYGMLLKAMLAGREILSEKLLPEFELSIEALFRAEA